jgi:L-gulonate 3-dehydrogenase
MNINRITIFGIGAIGTAWAVVFASAGFQVTLYDPERERLRQGSADIGERLLDLASHSLLEESVDVIKSRIACESDVVQALQSADYVQECGPEDIQVKQQIFETFAIHCPSTTILASSSSAIAISKIAADNSARARCLVVHPGNPPYLLRVAEIVPAPFTDAATVTAVQELFKAIGIIPVSLKREVEGFVFNRLQGALLREAYCLVRDGIVSPTELDQMVQHGLGLRWSVIGPFETVELNTRGGIQAHALRMGPAYARMGKERGQNDPWTPDMVQTVADDLVARSAGESWEDRVAKRDRRLMAMYGAQKKIGLGVEHEPSKPPKGT